MSTYACSDIHGQYELYKKMLDGIQFSDKDRLFVLGDVIDRGPQSIELLKDIMNRKNVKCLLGNHELMMIDHYRGNVLHDYWCYKNNGGDVTKAQFETLSQKEKNKIMHFLYNLRLQVELKIKDTTFLLSHSYFMENKRTIKWKYQYYQDVHEVVWNSPWRMSEYRCSNDYKADKRWHIIGHVPVQSIPLNQWETTPTMPMAYVDKKHHLVNIDLCCARYGNEDNIQGKSLCCMNLESFVNGEDAFKYFD